MSLVLRQSSYTPTLPLHCTIPLQPKCRSCLLCLFLNVPSHRMFYTCFENSSDRRRNGRPSSRQSPQMIATTSSSIWLSFQLLHMLSSSPTIQSVWHSVKPDNSARAGLFPQKICDQTVTNHFLDTETQVWPLIFSRYRRARDLAHLGLSPTCVLPSSTSSKACAAW